MRPAREGEDMRATLTDSKPTVAPLPLKRGDFVAGRYEIEDLAGEGGMAAVYSARHMHLDERYAIKVLKDGFSTNAHVVSRFLQEARAAAQLRSDFSCRVFDVGLLANGAPYMVMELLLGEDLQVHLSRNGPLSVEQAVEFVIEACDALAEAHGVGLVHRDVKPANLFVVRRPDGWRTVKLLDFGISKIVVPDMLSASMRRHVDTRDLLGTPHYMAPEQVRSSRDADARSDLWSLGVVLYELLSGRLPFAGTTVPEISASILETDPASLTSLRPELPRDLVDTVHWCLAKQNELRVSSAAELAAQLLPFAPRRSRAVVERMQSRARAQGEIIQMPPSAFPPALVPPPPPVPQSLVGVSHAPADREASPMSGRRRSMIWAGAAVLAFAVAGGATWLSRDGSSAAGGSSADTAPRPRESAVPVEPPPSPSALATAAPAVSAPTALASTAASARPEEKPLALPALRPIAPASSAKPDAWRAPSWDNGPDMGF